MIKLQWRGCQYHAEPQGGMNMPVSKAQQKATNKYITSNYDRINLTVAKGRKADIQVHAAARGESVNAFIGRAIEEAMERDGSGGPVKARGVVQDSVGISLVPKTLETAQKAAEAAGETLEQFMERAVVTQAERDRNSLRLGINPAAGDKLEKEA